METTEQPNGSETEQDAEQSFQIAPPNISLRKGGGAVQGIGEKFSNNPVTGTGTMSVPIAASPGRGGFGPQSSLNYDSGAGNGNLGLGWNLAVPSITRKTDKGLPRYFDSVASDEFLLSGAEELVPVLVQDRGDWRREPLSRIVNNTDYRIERYRPRVEGGFARIERWTNTDDASDCSWRTISRDNVTSWYGKSSESRVANPNDANQIYSWLLCESHDDKGNVMIYRYKSEDSAGIDHFQAHERNRNDLSRSNQRYLKRILYGNFISPMGVPNFFKAAFKKQDLLKT